MTLWLLWLSDVTSCDIFRDLLWPLGRRMKKMSAISLSTAWRISITKYMASQVYFACTGIPSNVGDIRADFFLYKFLVNIWTCWKILGKDPVVPYWELSLWFLVLLYRTGTSWDEERKTIRNLFFASMMIMTYCFCAAMTLLCWLGSFSFLASNGVRGIRDPKIRLLQRARKYYIAVYCPFTYLISVDMLYVHLINI